jgi:putative flippase GtrA
MRNFGPPGKPEINEILPSLRREACAQGLRMSVEKLEMRAPAPDPLRALAEHLPRPLRFLGVGGIGLTTDICVFTILMGYAPRPLLMRLLSLALATLVTWRLNRALTFDHSGRGQGDEAMRYAAVTAASQGTSYAVFAALVLSVFGALPQAALIAGAVVGAIVGYNGHRLFAFAKVPR